MNINKKRTTWEKVRYVAQTLHLYLGLAAGIVLIAICFSGTAYVFNTEFTEMSSPHLYKVAPVDHAQRIAPENFLQPISEKYGKVTAVYIPAAKDRSYRFDVKKKGDEGRPGTSYFVNPYSGKILGSSAENSSTRKFMSAMFSLHRWLLLDRIEKPLVSGLTNKAIGSKITGWATIIFTLGCLTGIIIWFPRKIRNWRQGLKINTKARWKRIVHDLHNVPAFYALIFLLLMGLTGPQWSFKWYRTGLQKSLGTYQAKQKVEKDKRPGEQTNADQQASITVNLSGILEDADKIFIYKGDYTVRFPENAGTDLNITKNKTGFFAAAAGDKIIASASTGKFLKVDHFKEKPVNERIAGSIKALHTGSIYGLFTKLLYFFACLIATTLPVTGTIIWINKLKKRRTKNTLQTIVKQPASITYS